MHAFIAPRAIAPALEAGVATASSTAGHSGVALPTGTSCTAHKRKNASKTANSAPPPCAQASQAFARAEKASDSLLALPPAAKKRKYVARESEPVSKELKQELIAVEGKGKERKRPVSWETDAVGNGRCSTDVLLEWFSVVDNVRRWRGDIGGKPKTHWANKVVGLLQKEGIHHRNFRGLLVRV